MQLNNLTEQGFSQILPIKHSVKKYLSILQEVRENIGDAQMIKTTDQIFQRVHLKVIQRKHNYVSKQYKLVVDRIEQEMETKAE